MMSSLFKSFCVVYSIDGEPRTLLNLSGMATRRPPVPMYRVLLVQVGNQWLAQCVDFDMSAQGPSDALAIGAFLRILKARYQKDKQLGREPFESLPAPPERFAKAWDRSARTS